MNLTKDQAIIRNEHLTRDEAIKFTSFEIVKELDNIGCEPTNRLQPEWDNTREYKASISLSDDFYGTHFLHAWYFPEEGEFWNSYYYPDIEPEDDEQIEDEGMINWEIAYYTLD
jgi:hypothetical protein